MDICFQERLRMDFTAFYEENAGWMFRLAKAILKNEQDAEDALQEAFLTVVRKWDFYTSLDKDALKAALTVITRSRSVPVAFRHSLECTFCRFRLPFPGLYSTVQWQLGWRRKTSLFMSTE